MELLKVIFVILLYLAVLGFGILCARLMDRRDLSRKQVQDLSPMLVQKDIHG